MSTHTPKGPMATRTPPQTRTAQQTLAAYTPSKADYIIDGYRSGDRLEDIAETVDADLHTVARELRHAGVLAPVDDPRTLAHLHHDYDHSLTEIAAVFPDGPGAEMVRRRMKRYGIDRRGQTLSQLLTEADPGDVGDPLPAAFNEGESA